MLLFNRASNPNGFQRYDAQQPSDVLVPYFVPRTLLSKSERTLRTTNGEQEALMALVRLFYGDSEIGREASDAYHKQAVADFAQSLADMCDGCGQDHGSIIVFNNEAKFRYDEFTTPESLPGCLTLGVLPDWVLHVVGSLLAIMSKCTEQHSEFFGEVILMIGDRGACEGRGYLRGVLTHDGRIVVCRREIPSQLSFADDSD